MPSTDPQVETSTPKKKSPPVARNGVDTPALFATINAVGAQPALARFRFQASNRWLSGTHSRTRIETFAGAGTEHAHAQEFSYDGDHPAVLCGTDKAPTPVEFLLHALVSCLTAGIANIAAARGVTLHKVESRIEGEIDLQGILGLSESVRNGYQRLRVSFRIEGDAPADKLRALVAQSQARSAVYDVLTRGVPIEIAVDAG